LGHTLHAEIRSAVPQGLARNAPRFRRALRSFELQDPSRGAAAKQPGVTLFQRSRKNALREGLIGIAPISTCKTMMRPNQM